jgi:hypothetical protein
VLAGVVMGGSCRGCRRSRFRQRSCWWRYSRRFARVPARRFLARLGDGDDAIEERSLADQRVIRVLLDAERAALLALRNDWVIDDIVMQRDIDLKAARLG